MSESNDHSATAELEPRHALFAGGGSGGHVYPGLAVAEELAGRGWTVTWSGRREGMERRLVERAGVPYVELDAAPLVGQGVVGKGRALWTLLRSALAGRRLIGRLDADVVIGTGGYVSAPAVLGARMAGRPSLLIEPNAGAGAANRFLSRWATAASVGYDTTGEEFRCPVEVTGVPVRAAFFDERAAGRRRPALLVIGGSQGAEQLNRLLPPALAALADTGVELDVVHQTGEAHLAAVCADYATRSLGGVAVEAVPFLDDMPTAMGRADLAVSRAGAITLAELCAAGLPSLLVPLQIAGGHQVDNARRLEASGACVLAGGDELTSGDLATLLRALLEDEDRRARMTEAARSLAHRQAAVDIADIVVRLEEAA